MNQSIKDLLSAGLPTSAETIQTASGWVRFKRHVGTKTTFLCLYDGSSLQELQCVCLSNLLSEEDWKLVRNANVGSSFQFQGKLIDSPAEGQKYEFQVRQATLLGDCPPAEFPLAKNEFTMEYFRQYPHLRSRTRIMQAIMRIRSSLAFATHEFFRQYGFVYLHTPLITGSDCEGAGEVFRIAPIGTEEVVVKNTSTKTPAETKPAEATPAEAKPTEAKPTEATPSTQTKQAETKPAEPTETKITRPKEFFGKPAFLTVSGQLNAETYACGMSRVYTFGPTFRADPSQTNRHLSEFWMIEPEIAFFELPQLMPFAQRYVQFCIQQVLANHSDDLAFLEEKQSPELLKRLTHLVNTDFIRLPYTEAIKQLNAHEDQKLVEFAVKVYWGLDLSSEHEKYLVDVIHHGIPVILYDYPSSIKPFYMKENSETKYPKSVETPTTETPTKPSTYYPPTVSAMDMLVPGIGELIGGSQRETDTKIIINKMKRHHHKKEDYQEYLDLRKFGSVPHSGFGLGFDRLVLLCTGTASIKDVIPFPRSMGYLPF